jgi:peptidoglycan biosynthesis protein MviN/MurJ (putative lipid II flippase)
MVMPVQEKDGPKWRPQWKWWIIGIGCASVFFAGVWWLITRDFKAALDAALIPWSIALVFLCVVLAWTLTTAPLMALMVFLAKHSAPQNRKRPRSEDRKMK